MARAVLYFVIMTGTAADLQNGLFSTFVLSLASAAFIELGIVEDPATKKKRKNLESAKQHISLIEMIEQKTHGNLQPEEKQLLEHVLTDLRLQYVKISEEKK